MPEAARSEMHSDPNSIGLIGEDIDVMIAATDSAQLRRRGLLQFGQGPQGPGGIIK